METLGLPRFDGPLTAVAINEWLIVCERKFEIYNLHRPVTERISDLEQVLLAGDKISDKGDTHALADWFNSQSGNFKGWRDFKVRLKDRALPIDWLARAVEALFTTKQGDSTADAYLQVVYEYHSVINNSALDSAKGKSLLSINDDVLKYIILFNAKPTVRAAIMDSGNVVTASVKEIRDNLRQASHNLPSTSNDAQVQEDAAEIATGHSAITTRWAIEQTLTYSGDVYSMALSPDGNLIAIAGSDGVELWDVMRNSNLARCKVTAASHINLSTDGDVVWFSVGFDCKTLNQWKWRVEERPSILYTCSYGESIRSTTLSADGTVLAVGTGGDILLWSLPLLLGPKRLGKPALSTFALSQDKSYLAVGSADGSIDIWNISTNKLDRSLRGHSKKINTIASSGDGKLLVSGAPDNTARLWSWDKQNSIATIRHPANVYDVALSADGKFGASISTDGTVILWHTPNMAECATFYTDIKDRTNPVVFSRHGLLLAYLLNNAEVVVRRGVSGKDHGV